MSFLSALKNAFGFGPDYDEPEASDASYISADPQSVSESTQGEPSSKEGAELPTPPVVSPERQRQIFEGVVAIFNSSLPDFLQRSVDSERQAQLIADSLDASLRNYLTSLADDAMSYARASLRAETDEAQREAERLRREMSTLEQERTNIRDKQLSADRRRRAMADRVTDLESQLAAAEAEKEQYELEKRSLLNKIKVSEVQSGMLDEMQQEIDRLKTVEIDSDSKEEVESLKAQVVSLQEALHQNKEQVEMTQAMYNDLQSKFAEEHDVRTRLEAEAEEAKKIFETVVNMQSQMQEVETLIRKRDERIARLKSTNKRLKEELAQTQAELERSLSRTDVGLFALNDSEPTEVCEPEPRNTDAIPDLDDDFECPDWFVSKPAPGEPGLRKGEDTEFGYTEPPKKAPRPENDAQLSLF